MTTTAKQIEALKKSLNLMTRIADNMTGADYEDLDAMHRTIRDAKADLFELELSLTPATDEDGQLIAA